MRSALAPDLSDGPDRAAFLMLLGFVLAEPFLSETILSTSAGVGTPVPLGRLLLNVFAFLTAGAALLSRSALPETRPLVVPLGAAGGLALLGAIQLLPLPEGLMQRIASVNLQIYHETSEILRLFGRASVPAARISIAPGETLATTLALLACIAIFLAAASVLRDRTRRRLFGWTVVIGAVLRTLELVLARPVPTGSGASAPNLSAAAGFLGISLCVAFGILWAEILVNSERGIGTVDAAERFERRFGPLAIRGAAWLVIAAGLALTRVESALFSTITATLVLLGLGLARRRNEIPRSSRGTTGALVGVGLGLAALAGAAATTSGAGIESRMATWKTSIAAWRLFPLFGSGLGTFREAFRRTQPRDLQGLIDQARSEPLELLVTGGLVGLALGAVAAIALLVLLLRASRSQRHREESAISLAAFGALLFWLLDTAVESNASPLGVLTLLCAVLGSGWAASQARGIRAL